MGCVISCGLKLVLQILNTILFIAFLCVAIFGILLKVSKPVVESIITKIFEQFKIGDDDLRQLAIFIVENAVCCGMDGHTDFNVIYLPSQCCKYTLANPPQICDSTEAERIKIPGCREKIVTFISDNLQITLYFSIGAILLQAVLIAIVFLSICL
ncbi:hypothetical protein ACTXT7_010590 [Hymenolepis weldensis]